MSVIQKIFTLNAWKRWSGTLFSLFTWGNWMRLIDAIPLLQPLASFSRNSHGKALKKWFVLVFAASAPVLITVLLSPVPDGNLSFFEKMIIKITESISVSDQFVYIAAFLAPTLYLVVEKFFSAQDNYNHKLKETSSERIRNSIKVYRGYGWVLLVSFVVLFMTAFGFGFIKTQNQGFNHTFLYGILNEGSIYIYLFALYAFYLSIVQENGADGGYSKAMEDGEKNVTSGLSQRVARENQQ